MMPTYIAKEYKIYLSVLGWWNNQTETVYEVSCPETGAVLSNVSLDSLLEMKKHMKIKMDWEIERD